MQRYRLEEEWLELPSGKGPEGVGRQPYETEYEQVVCPGSQEGQQHPGLYQEQRGQQDWGSDCPPVLGTDITPSPSVYRLTSKDVKDFEMCLITDYSPENLTLNSTYKPTNATVEVATSENKQEASYLSTYWAKKDEMRCRASINDVQELEGEGPESARLPQCSCDFHSLLLLQMKT
ncbi:t cell receptor hypothetical protein [Limosa lapponica baueri]|uniref:T-cell receptor alpha chain constant domain-containing protein n=1 Tax=Limosa lapponica baueri TaxID=1758121 RepID=A0A2I0TQH0_LIMLA|nr:t cell receptor hypothetical protein [Limosa lapponica baueri]